MAVDSDDESVISILDEEWVRLADVSLFKSYSSSLPIFIHEELVSKKRVTYDSDPLPKGDSSDLCKSKRHCVDGSALRKVTEDPFMDHAIPDIFYDTIFEKIDLPLHFFESSSLVWVLHHASEVRTIGSRPLGSRSDDTRILVINWLTEKLDSNKENSDFSYARWLNATGSYLRFQASHDSQGNDNPWAKIWFSHFKFFENKLDAERTYPFWRDQEREFRTNIVLDISSYNVIDYQQIYRFAQSSYRTSNVVSSSSPPPPPSSNSHHSSGNAGNSNSARSSHPNQNQNQNGGSGGSQSFQNKNTLPLMCVICLGAHSAYQHSQQHLPNKFPNGKPCWAKSGMNGKAICTPSGDEICIKFNTLTARDVASRNLVPLITLTESMSALSVEVLITVPLHGGAANSLDPFLSATAPPPLSYSHIFVLPSFFILLSIWPYTCIKTFSTKKFSPYNVDAFELLLCEHHLAEKYPDLVTNLRQGFPLGQMGTLLETKILDNIVLSSDHWLLIDAYLLDEVSSGRIDGPFSCLMVESIL